MNEGNTGLPKAQIEKCRFSWLPWLVPIAAGLLCDWYVGHDIIFAGPTITIIFQNADGLQAENSLLQYRGVSIGEVETLKLAQDRQRVAVTVQIDPSAASIAQQGSVFWIVRPELKLGSVSGRGQSFRVITSRCNPATARAPTGSPEPRKRRLNQSWRWTFCCWLRNSVPCSRNRRFFTEMSRWAKSSTAA